MRIIVWIHTLYTQKWEFDYKPIWYLLEESCKNQYTAIKFSIDGWAKTRRYLNWVFADFSEISIIPKRPTVLRYIMEVIYMFFYLIFMKFKYWKISYLGIDPLSCFAGAILRKIKIVDKCILITPDYADMRFENKLLNSMYFFCDKICTLWSDYNYCSSTETIKRKKILYKVREDNLKHIPWQPPYSLVKKIQGHKTEKIKHNIVFVWWVYGQLDFELIFDQIALLRKDIPDISLSIIWDGSHLPIYEKYLKDKGYVEFIHLLGYLDYEDALVEIQKAEIWLALYNGDLFFDKYRDSCKVRDYLAFDVVPIMTDVVPSTAEDLIKFNAGVVIGKDDVGSLTEILGKILLKKDSFYSWIQQVKGCHQGKYLELINDLKHVK